MKIVTVVGARPQFIKAAAVSRKLREEHQEVMIHTGQHYDPNMSEIFFEELKIPHPDINLGVGSGSHAKQTAEMLVGVESILLKESPDYLMVYGDTNSTLAGALAASKLHIPVIHVEAGLRSYNMLMPEEQNRVLTDHISSLLLCPTNQAVDNLEKEGITKGVHNIGDVMCDAVLFYSGLMEQFDRTYYFDRVKSLYEETDQVQAWYLATIHRAENTDDAGKIERILNAFEAMDEKVIFPVHPRTRHFIDGLYQEHQYKNILFIEPVGYLDMLYFAKNAKKVVTDSGGLQKEAYILNTPCVTVRDQTEWVETLKGGFNVLTRPDTEEILDKVNHVNPDQSMRSMYYGEGDAAEKLCRLLRG